LEIDVAVRRTIAYTALQIATCTVARLEFEVIGAGDDWADDNREGAIAVDVGSDNSKFDRRYRFGHTLPCGYFAGTAAAVNRKLAEGRRKRGAKEVESNLIKLAGPGAHQGKGHRQFARGRNGPTDFTFLVVKRFIELVPTCGPLLRRPLLRRCRRQRPCRLTRGMPPLSKIFFSLLSPYFLNLLVSAVPLCRFGSRGPCRRDYVRSSEQTEIVPVI
jgi:hypothetical protein